MLFASSSPIVLVPQLILNIQIWPKSTCTIKVTKARHTRWSIWVSLMAPWASYPGKWLSPQLIKQLLPFSLRWKTDCQIYLPRCTRLSLRTTILMSKWSATIEVKERNLSLWCLSWARRIIQIPLEGIGDRRLSTKTATWFTTVETLELVRWPPVLITPTYLAPKNSSRHSHSNSN